MGMETLYDAKQVPLNRFQDYKIAGYCQIIESPPLEHHHKSKKYQLISFVDQLHHSVFGKYHPPLPRASRNNWDIRTSY